MQSQSKTGKRMVGNGQGWSTLKLLPGRVKRQRRPPPQFFQLFSVRPLKSTCVVAGFMCPFLARHGAQVLEHMFDMRLIYKLWTKESKL